MKEVWPSVQEELTTSTKTTELLKWLNFFREITEKINTLSRHPPNCFLEEFLYQPISFEEVGFPNVFPPNC